MSFVNSRFGFGRRILAPVWLALLMTAAGCAARSESLGVADLDYDCGVPRNDWRLDLTFSKRPDKRPDLKATFDRAFEVDRSSHARSVRKVVSSLAALLEAGAQPDGVDAEVTPPNGGEFDMNRVLAIEALRWIASQGHEVSPALPHLAATYASGWIPNARCLFREVGAPASDVAFALATRKDAPVFTRASAFVLLADIGAHDSSLVRPFLEMRAALTVEDFLAEASFAFETMLERSIAAREELLDVLNDREAIELRKSALELLGFWLEPSRAKRAFVEAVDGIARDSHGSLDLRLLAMRALLAIHGPVAYVRTALDIAADRTEKPEMRVAALETLTQYGKPAYYKRHVARIATLAKEDESEAVRKTAVTLLERLAEIVTRI